MTEQITYQRFACRRVKEALADTPVVLIHGSRQSGKTTLARMVGDSAGYKYVTFDDEVWLSAAKYDPIGFIGDLPNKTILSVSDDGWQYGLAFGCYGNNFRGNNTTEAYDNPYRQDQDGEMEESKARLI